MDRDGTITQEVGYVNHVSRLRLLPRSGAAIRRINEAGLYAVVITNQSGVARGYFPEELVIGAHKKLEHLLAEQGAHLDGIYYCPHHPEGKVEKYRQRCNCRKPAPGMLEQAAADLGIDLVHSFVVGDKIDDVYMAHQVGARGILVLTGYGRGEYELHASSWHQLPDYVAEDLYAAVEWILKQMRVH